MAGERLHEFSLDLCDYIQGQFRPHLRKLPGRPESRLTQRDHKKSPNYTNGDDTEWNQLDLPGWVGRCVATLPVPLADHVWAGVAGDKILLPLNDAELFALAAVVDDPPMRLESTCGWEPFPALHRRAVECVAEIQSALTQQHANEWAADSSRLGSRLCEEGLPLAEGVTTVHEWLWCARRLLQAMGATRYLPAPDGYHPTPTVSEAAAALPSDPRFGPERFEQVVYDLRRAIGNLPDGVHAKPDVVIKQAAVQKQIGRLALRWLETRGEYRGFGRKTPARYRRAE